MASVEPELAAAPPSPPSAPATPRARGRPALNPVLVKEVRQALRGRSLQVAFTLGLAAATLVAAFQVVRHAGRPPEMLGRDYFQTVFFCLVVAVNGLVPFAAFVSMAGEHDEGTHDLLVLSGLRPLQIVLGKLASAAVGTGLFLCAFGPLLACTFLMQGIDPRAVLFCVASVTCVSLGLSAVALALGAAARVRAVRVLLMAGLVGLQVFLTIGTIASASELVRRPGTLRDPDFSIVLGVGASIWVLVLGFSLTIACALLTHPEEDRSTGPRAMTLLLATAICAWLGGLYLSIRQAEVFAALGGVVHVLCFAPFVFFVTEPERLGRRARTRVPRSRVRALLAAPFLPGGGRALLLWLVMALGLALVCVLLDVVARELRTPFYAALPGLVFGGYVFAFLGLGSRLFSGRSQRPGARVAARLVLPAAVLLLVVGQVLAGFLAGNDGWMELEYGINAFTVSGELAQELGRSNGRPLDAGLAISLGVLFVVVAATLAVNARRMKRGVREVLEASADRRAREAAGGG